MDKRNPAPEDRVSSFLGWTIEVQPKNVHRAGRVTKHSCEWVPCVMWVATATKEGRKPIVGPPMARADYAVDFVQTNILRREAAVSCHE